MWGTQYDENLRNNPFFSEILTNHSDLLFKASQENWIICIPRNGILEPHEITISTILDHILVPNSYTLSKKRVSIENKTIATPSTTSKILFQETFYIESLKYSVFCIDKPLFLCRTICDKVPTLETLDDCIDFLWSENLSHVLHKIQNLCGSFIEQHPNLPLETLQSQKDTIGSLYSQCLQLALRSRDLRNCDNVKIAVETYMQSCLDRTLIRAVNTVACFSDACLNKLIRNLTDLQLNDLNIASKFYDVVTSAKSELCKINNYVTVLDKVNCLKLTFNHLCNSSVCLTTDDLLQILVFLIVKLNVSNWSSNLVYLSHFQFSCTPSSETSFVITSLEAALEFIKTARFSKTSHQTPMFQAVISDDLPLVKEALMYKSAKLDLCHPLCDCENCTSNSSHVTTNEKGQSLLIFATIHGRPEIVEYLLSIVEVDSRDYFGRSPLHYACLKGHQDVLLILRNSKADCNAKDNDGNTPLHLACDNGHENCVKALFYTSKHLDVDCVNRHGDTPLHLAVKWNYVEIARVLLENNAGVHIFNKKNQTPVMLARNYHTEKLFRSLDPPEPVVSHCNDHGIKPASVEQLKKIDLLLKAIENNDFPLTCFYLGFSSSAASDFKSKCHPLCNCEKCEDSDGGAVAPEPLNVNSCNIDGFTPLHFAAKYGRSELVRLLLDSHARPNLKTYKTLQTPLHLACIHRRFQTVKDLVACQNCDVDSRDYKGCTPLYYACLKKDSKIVEVLLEGGARSCSR